MRVLDLGGHDGFMATWLDRKALPVGTIEQYDGLDFNPESVRRANDRLGALGLAGEFKVGAAEDAALYFDPGTYDVVLCFEVIEHVKSVPALLDAIEVMTAPDGRAYVSTPTGVFGQGGNPLHLRAWAPSQLGDVLRRRGKLIDLEAGEDGTTSGVYVPSGDAKPEVVIHTGSAWERWSPADIADKGLGGSETAAARLAFGLAEQGHVVTVYGNVHEGLYRDVIFRHEGGFDPTEEVDLLIASRIPELADADAAAKVKVLWTHDTDFADRLTKPRADYFDFVVALSKWHKGHLAGLYPFLGEKLVQLRNGLHLPYYDGARPWAERDPLLLYTSSPDRGLDVLLDLWPDVLERCRARDVEPTFAFCYASVYDAVAKQRPDVAAHHRELQALIAARENVDQLAAQPQPNLAKMLGFARVWAHPSWHSPGEQAFHETYCIGAAEAQASGCSVVASNWGALPETVKVGTLVGSPGDNPGDEEWSEPFIDAIVAGLCEENEAHLLAPPAVADLSWQGVADGFSDLLARGAHGATERDGGPSASEPVEVPA